MLAQEPQIDRAKHAGGISVSVNGTPVDQTVTAKVVDSVERLSGIRDKIGSSSSEWAKTTITLRSGAQRYAEDGSSKLMDNNSCASLSLQKEDALQLVHVISIKPGAAANSMDKPEMSAAPKSPTVEIKSNGTAFESKSNADYTKGKVSVVVGASPLKNDEDRCSRSSSGNSSALNSDGEKSDSDRDADDGTDSGISRSTHRACIVNIKARKDSCGSSNGDVHNGSPTEKAINGKGNVRLTISSYADQKSDENKLDMINQNPWDMQFHMRELDQPTDTHFDSVDIQTRINAALALLQGKPNGTFSLKNRVRSSIVSLMVQSKLQRNFDQEECGRVVFYTTSMGVVRLTKERCRKVKKILDTLMIRYEERDVFMNRGFQKEVKERLGLNRLVLPQLFIEGRHLGSAEIIEQLNEIGHLRVLLRPYKKTTVGEICKACCGYQFVLCKACRGSKKSMTHRHNFSVDHVALRCVHCDDSGLSRCQMCVTGEVIAP